MELDTLEMLPFIDMRDNDNLDDRGLGRGEGPSKSVKLVTTDSTDGDKEDVDIVPLRSPAERSVRNSNFCLLSFLNS